MIKTLSILCVTASLSLAQQFVHPTRTDYNIVLPNVQMPESLWTNSVLWPTAESPVLNEGATNANWICYAKNRVSNIYQTGTGYQPTSIVTNGVAAWSFDGTDDMIRTSSTTISTNPFTFSAWVFPLVSNVEQCLIGEGSSHGGGTTRAILGISQYGGTRWRLSGYDASGSLFQPTGPGAVATGVWTHVVGVWDGSNAFVSVNGVAGTSAAVTSLRTTGTFFTSLGNGADRLRAFQGYVAEAFVSNKPLSTNEISDLYDLGKWRRGE
jgi:hypothetical protein